MKKEKLEDILKRYSIRNIWEGVFYMFGWLTGALFPLFWLIMAFLYWSKDAEHDKPFFNPNFHRRVYWWGVIWAIVFIISYLLGYLI